MSTSTRVSCTWSSGLPPRPGGARVDTEPAIPAITLDPPPSGSAAVRLCQFLRSLPARSRSLGLHILAPSLVSSALQESQPLLETGGLDDPVADGAGLVLPAAGAVVAAGSFGFALADKWDAKRQAWSSRVGQEKALSVLARCERGAGHAGIKFALKRQCMAMGPADNGLRRAALYLGAHRVPLSNPAVPGPVVDDAADSAMAAIARQRLEDELGRICAARDRQIAAHCVDFLDHVEAANRSTRADQSLLASALACVRDVGIDVPAVGCDAVSLIESAADGPLDMLLGAADVSSFALGGAGGAMQLACGAFELWQARRQREQLGRLGMLVRSHARRIAADARRAQRIMTPLARSVRTLFEHNRRAAMRRACRRRAMAWLRIGYGLLSLAASMAGAGMLLFLGAAVLAGTGGLALLAVSAAIGVSWLGVTGYRKIGRAFGDAMRHDERRALDKALELAAQRGLAAPSLAGCTLAQLEALPRHCPALQGNRHLLSALLARRLIIEGRDRHRGKKERIETATLLQALGMPRLWTTMLKRAPFGVAYRHIDAYFNDDGAVLALARGELTGAHLPPTLGECSAPTAAGASPVRG